MNPMTKSHKIAVIMNPSYLTMQIFCHRFPSLIHTGKQYFLLFPQCFFVYLIHQIFFLFSANAFHLGHAKILPFLTSSLNNKILDLYKLEAFGDDKCCKNYDISL